MTDQLVGAERIQDLLGVDRSTVYRMAGDGRLPAVKVGRQWRSPLEAVEQRLHLGARPEPTGEALGLDRGVVEPLLSVVAECLGVMMVVTDMRGDALTDTVNPCPWFLAHRDDPTVLEACTAHRRELAEDLDFAPHFSVNRFGYECARAFIRSGSALVGMVVAGGLAPGNAADPPGLHQLDDAGRAHVLERLPDIAAALSHLAGHAPEPVTA